MNPGQSATQVAEAAILFFAKLGAGSVTPDPLAEAVAMEGLFQMTRHPDKDDRPAWFRAMFYMAALYASEIIALRELGPRFHREPEQRLERRPVHRRTRR